MKKLIMILLPVLLLGGGGVFFAASKGMVNIPGVTPKKKAAAALYGEAKDKKLAAKPKPKPKPKEKKPVVAVEVNDPVLGRKKLAAVWNELKTDNLLKIIETWKNNELALQLSEMDPSKVTEILDALALKDPKRVSELSREIQEIGAKEPPSEDI